MLLFYVDRVKTNLKTTTLKTSITYKSLHVASTFFFLNVILLDEGNCNALGRDPHFKRKVSCTET